LAAAISEKFGVEAELIKGKNGVFDVVVNGNLVFSKHQAGRFPQNEEILGELGK
jgi:selenoprotein W-related protein